MIPPLDFKEASQLPIQREELKKLIISPIMLKIVQKKQIKSYFREVAKLSFRISDSSQDESFSVSTMYRWLNEYKQNGNQAFIKKLRADSGRFRALTDIATQAIKKIISENSHLTIQQVYDKLIALYPVKNMSYSTVYRFIKSNPMLPADEKQVYAVRAFEASCINHMWQTDVMYGPRLFCPEQDQIKKTVLFAIIDDYSRYVILAAFCFDESLSPFLKYYKHAMLYKGIPQILYTDNAKIYHSHRLARITALLSTSLVFTKPYAGYQKGKIERFFHTLRSQFLNTFTSFENITIEMLNGNLQEWIDTYHHTVHSATKETPFNRFFSNVPSNGPFKSLATVHIDDFLFDDQEFRKVRNDGTISIKKIFFEVPQQLIGQKIIVRFDPEKLDQPDYAIAVLDLKEQVIGSGKQLNKQQNFYKKRHVIDYTNIQ